MEQLDINKSLELKKKYRHRIKHCYRNAYSLLMNNEIDKIVYGYCTNDNKTFVRHAWGLKDNKIIDTTFRKHELQENKYIKMFELDTKELFNAMMETTGPHLLEYEEGFQTAFLMSLKDKHGEEIIIA